VSQSSGGFAGMAGVSFSMSVPAAAVPQIENIANPINKPAVILFIVTPSLV
jgi:hypothetical protein